MRKAFLVFAVVALSLTFWGVLQAQTTSNLLAGDGLFRARSAKPLAGFPFQLRTFGTYRGYNLKLDSTGTLKDQVTQVWGYQFLAFAPTKHVELDITTRQDNAKVKWANPQGRDESYGLLGDGLVGLKLHVPLKTPALDIAVEPFASIPTASDTDTVKLRDWYSQSGGVDFGGMLLMDVNLSKTTLYLNGGYVKHANQESQVLGAGGLEFAPSPYFSGYLEGSVAYRLNQNKAIAIPDWQIPYYGGEQYTAARITPGMKVNAGNFLSLDLAADIGVTTFGPKWQMAVGLSAPSALRVRTKAAAQKRGVIAGRITDEKTGKPLDALITFPGSVLASLRPDKLTGDYSVGTLPGDYTVKVLADGYLPQEKRVTLANKGQESLNFALAKKAPPLGTLVGRIFDALTDKALPASFALPGVEGGKISSDVTTGGFTVKLAPGTYSSAVIPDLANYLPEKLSFDIKSEAISNVAVSMVKKGEKISLPGVKLLGTQATLAPESYPVLERIGKVLTDRKGLRLVIGGHVDSRGSLKRQLALSQSMANSVKNYLVQQLNVAGDRLFVNAYGGSMPVTTNRTAAGRLQNRRVEMMILGEGDKVPEVAMATPAPPTPTPTPTPNPTPTPTPTPKPTPTPTPTPTPGPSADAQSAYRAGVEAYFNDQYDKAIANFERCLKLDPSNSKARDYIAKARAKAAKVKGK